MRERGCRSAIRVSFDAAKNPSNISHCFPDVADPSTDQRLLRFAVVGGGVSGLAAAYRLHQLAPAAELRLYEAGPRLGGPLDTDRRADVVLERGADSFLARDPAVVELCRELGLGDELLSTNAEHRRALVVCRARLEPVPAGFVLMQPHNALALLRSPVLSLSGRLRALAEPLAPARAAAPADDDDESVASFAARRLGREAFERLIEPLLAGIYVADAAELSLAATMPEFLAAEREHGSLAAARRAQRRSEGPPAEGSAGARYGAFLTLRSGMSALVDALAARLPAGTVQLAAPIAAVAKSGSGRWSVTTAAGAAEEFDGVVLAGPARRMAPLVEACDAELAALLAQIRAASSVVVTLIYARRQIAHPLDGFGFVVPRVEDRLILAGSFPSVKFPGRGNEELTPIRVFLGGALRPTLGERDDAELVAIATRELAELLDAHGPPREAIVARWPESMPQYRVGHLKLVRAIGERLAAHRGLEVAGASYRGVGIPQCLRSGREAAERLVGPSG
jgi:oxygen-dependent protoporphyrinogen oxidase